jgi:ribonucleoside-triphosphate reductase (formate)
MNVNIRLNKNFTTAFNKMQDTYGEELSKINGFSDGQLSYTDFIDNFVDSDTVADASVDGNANVGQKDIVTLVNEMPNHIKSYWLLTKFIMRLIRNMVLK